eukprot:359556_1
MMSSVAIKLFPLLFLVIITLKPANCVGSFIQSPSRAATKAGRYSVAAKHSVGLTNGLRTSYKQTNYGPSLYTSNYTKRKFTTEPPATRVLSHIKMDMNYSYKKTPTGEVKTLERTIVAKSYKGDLNKRKSEVIIEKEDDGAHLMNAWTKANSAFPRILSEIVLSQPSFQFCSACETQSTNSEADYASQFLMLKLASKVPNLSMKLGYGCPHEKCMNKKTWITGSVE